MDPPTISAVSISELSPPQPELFTSTQRDAVNVTRPETISARRLIASEITPNSTSTISITVANCVEASSNPEPRTSARTPKMIWGAAAMCSQNA